MIDRGSMGEGLGKVRKRTSWTPILVVVLVTIPMLGVAASLIVQTGNSRESLRSETPIGTHDGMIYATHNPISIIGNAGFSGPNATTGIVRGTGTESDPYIIEGLRIMSTTSPYAIYVKGTDLFFVVRACSLKGATASISLENVENANVTENELLGDSYGVLMQTVSNNIVSNNNCTVSACGIELFDSFDDVIDNNTISCADQYGIDLGGCVNITASNNSMVDCGLVIMAWKLDQANTHTIGASNTVRGKPLYYYKNLDGATVAADAGEVILGACSNMTIRNMSFSQTVVGILLAYSSNVLVEDVLSWNMSWCGINLDYCTNVSIVNSSFNNNENNGIFISSSTNTLVRGCTASWNHEGIIVWMSTKTELRDNECAWNGDGLFIDYSWNLTLTGNTLSHNGLTMIGYDLGNWNTHTIDDSNTVDGLPIIYIKDQIGGSIPNRTGVFILANCTDLVISGEDFDTGGWTAVIMAFATNVTIEDCVFSQNSIGLYMQRSSNNQIVRNTFTDSGLCIYAQYCEHNLFSENNITSSATGLDLDADSNWNEVTFNRFQQNSQYAIAVERGSSGNSIYDNQFVRNHGADLTYNPSMIQAYDDSGQNYWNASDHGNNWFDWTTPDVNPADGIVDQPYAIDGGAGAKDYYPLTAPPGQPIPEFGLLPLVAMTLMAMVVLARTRSRKNKFDL